MKCHIHYIPSDKKRAAITMNKLNSKYKLGKFPFVTNYPNSYILIVQHDKYYNRYFSFGVTRDYALKFRKFYKRFINYSDYCTFIVNNEIKIDFIINNNLQNYGMNEIITLWKLQKGEEE
jgi:hypothetical protein